MLPRGLLPFVEATVDPAPRPANAPPLAGRGQGVRIAHRQDGGQPAQAGERSEHAAFEMEDVGCEVTHRLEHGRTHAGHAFAGLKAQRAPPPSRRHHAGPRAESRGPLALLGRVGRCRRRHEPDRVHGPEVPHEVSDDGARAVVRRQVRRHGRHDQNAHGRRGFRTPRRARGLAALAAPEERPSRST